MPIHEFYCRDCHTIFNFFSRTLSSKREPMCPKCRERKLEKQISTFAMTGHAKEPAAGGGGGDLAFDESKMEKALNSLASEAEGLNEEDPRQAAQLMRKFTDMTGMELGKGMTEALDRMESGEDPEQIEKDMGDVLEGEDPFLIPDKKGKIGSRNRPPARDHTLYDL